MFFSTLFTILDNIVEAESGVTILFNIVDNCKQCGKQNIVQTCFHLTNNVFHRSRSQLDQLGIKSDEIKRATDRVIQTTEWKNTMTAAEDIELSHLEEKLEEAQRKLEDLKSLLAKKCDTWRSGLDRIQDNICKTENTIASCEELLANKNDQRWKQRVKRKAKEIFEERWVKRRALSNQGRPCLLDSEDEEFLAKSIEDKATYHGRRKDTVMYTSEIQRLPQHC
jgi:hypothetical protein